jgi:serine/threonine protein kinase
MSVALSQLHGCGIAHQDLKPSNVLIFDRTVSKLGDFGRASVLGAQPPHEDNPYAGDPGYAPLELLYHEVDPDWHRRRAACDLYLLGSLIVVFFLGVATTPAVLSRLRTQLQPRTWTGTYRDVLPYVRDAFGEVLLALRPALPAGCRDELETAARQLCEPDPALRGHPRNRAGTANPYSLERFVSTFNHLARRAEYAARKMS